MKTAIPQPIRLLLLFALAAIPCKAFAEGKEQNEEFSLKPTVVSAIEGGPLVVKATVTYHGRDSVSVEESFGRPLVFMNNAGEYRARFVRGSGSGIRRSQALAISSLRLDRGGTITALTAVHRNYSAIPAGKNSLQFSWAFYRPCEDTNSRVEATRTSDPNEWKRVFEEREREKRKLVEFNETFEVEIQPATRENLLGCAKKLHSLLDTAKTLEDFDIVLQHVLHTPRKEFADVSARLLNCRLLHRYHYEIAQGMLKSAASERDGVASLVNYLDSPNPDAIEPVFSMLVWELPKKNLLTKETVAKLQSTSSIWPRAMINALAPNDCSPVWRWQLMQQLKLLKRPIPTEQLVADIKQLDHDSFVFRANAKANLVKKGEMAIPTMRELLRGKTLSLEAETNVKSVIARIEKAPPDPLEQQMMNCLAGCLLHNRYEEYFKDHRAEHLRQVENVLEALAHNHPDAWITKEAKRILAEAKQRKQ